MLPALIGAALAVVGGIFFTLPSSADAPNGGAPVSSDPARGDTQAEQAVLLAVRDFAAAYNTYDVADPQDYQQRVGPLLTESYRAEFVQITDALFTAIKAKEQKSTDADVKDVAIESIDADSATALVVVDAKVANTDSKNAVLRQFRWTVDLELVDGDWLVSSFESVAAAPAGGEATPTPAPTPTATGSAE